MAVTAFALAACTTAIKVRGAGTLGGAEFRIHADTCSGALSGRIQYRDAAADVRFNGEIVSIEANGPDCADGEAQFNLTYQKAGAVGVAVACAGEDTGSLQLLTGYYAGYSASGEVTSDTVTSPCP